MRDESGEMRENDLALISAAVYAYLSDGQPVLQSASQPADRQTGRPFIRQTGRRNRWKQAFFPQVNEKGMRCNQWSR
ncbi:MAG: hypothetical protein HZA49_06370 [Planctomycetes bacterium]|nr:hypothetical protein [Planctomycetota bacterium]